MSACDHPLDGYVSHGPWCETPDPVTDDEQAAIRRRQYLTELLRDTCKHLHTPEACQWCVIEQLNTGGPEVSRHDK